MNRFVFLSSTLILFFLANNPLLAQRTIEERIEARRIAYISTRLNLTPEESQLFWPIYNEYRQKREGINEKYRNSEDVLSLSDSEVEAAILQSLDKEQALLDLKKQYFLEMKKVIPVRKVAMLQHAERAFKEELLRELQERRSDRRGNPRSGQNDGY